MYTNFLLFFSTGDGEIECSCNFNFTNDGRCNNGTCMTDTTCERYVVYKNGSMFEDFQSCNKGSHVRPCGDVYDMYEGATAVVMATLCCTEAARCNANDTLMEQLIQGYLGMYMCVVLN